MYFGSDMEHNTSTGHIIFLLQVYSKNNKNGRGRERKHIFIVSTTNKLARLAGNPWKEEKEK